jgi:glycosyltransferase involved in cell wall biosynthesis
VCPVACADTITTCGSGESSANGPPATVKVLVVSPRMPAAGGKGDQLRAFQLVHALASGHSVEVVTTGGGVGHDEAAAELSTVAEVRIHSASLAERGLGGLSALLRAQPFQVGWMTPARAWDAIRRRSESSDVVLAITVRSVRGPLAAPLVLDHVDALSVNMRRRAAGPEAAPVRWAARLEAALLERWEHRLREHAAGQLAISPLDARLLPTPPDVHVVPNSIEIPETPDNGGERDIDVILTGNMAYPPNRDAARWLSDAIAPELWARRPETSIWVVGRRAGGLTLDSRIQVRADVAALAPYLRRAKVAVAPLRIGTGSPNKVLEAMAAGAAVVGTSAALEPFAFPPGATETGDTAQALARAAERLLADPSARSALAERSTQVVEAYTSEAQRERLEAVLRSVVP